MPIQLFKVTKRGADKPLHELGEISARVPSTTTIWQPATISMSFGYIPVQGSSDKYAVKGTADEFARLIERLAGVATSYEDYEEHGHRSYRFVPPAERSAYAIAWLRAIVDKMESDAIRRALALLSDPPRGPAKPPVHSLANAQSVLCLLRLGDSVGAWPAGTNPEELRQGAANVMGRARSYPSDAAGTAQAIADLSNWIAAREADPTL